MVGQSILSKSYYKILISKTSWPILLVFGIAIIYVVSMSFIEHRNTLFPYIILLFALIKTIAISKVTIRQLSKLMEICHSLDKLIWTFGILIFITIFSFATDYTCLYMSVNASFEGLTSISNVYYYNLYHFFYFSVITFSTVGYGDITPVSEIARFLVVLEIFMSFLIIIFALSNIRKIHINK